VHVLVSFGVACVVLFLCGIVYGWIIQPCLYKALHIDNIGYSVEQVAPSFLC
jgi:hypothetical protein